MHVNPVHRNAAKLIAFGFALGSAFQLGLSLTSHLSPRVEVIEIHTTDQGAAAPDRMSF